MKKGPSVSFENVGLTLGSTRILEEVSFKIMPGSIHCLIGPNGGGKTSLINCLAGRMPHTGTIRVDWNQGRTTGYVPQTLDFERTLPLTVDDFMAMLVQNRPAFLGIRKSDRAQITRILETVGMGDKRKRLMGKLSGGERQRVLLAQAMLPSPDLLILDEPTTGLDEEGAAILERTILDMKDQGVTTIWIHHDLGQVRKTADAVTCINRTVLFSGRPADHLTPDRIMNIFSAKSLQAMQPSRQAAS